MSDESPLPRFQSAMFLLYPHRDKQGGGGVSPLSLLMRLRISSTLTISLEPDYVPKASPLNTIQLEIRIST